MFLVLSLFFTSIGGLIVASILKNLDNVVKVVRNKVEYKLQYFTFRSTVTPQPTYLLLSSVPTFSLRSSLLQSL